MTGMFVMVIEPFCCAKGMLQHALMSKRGNNRSGLFSSTALRHMVTALLYIHNTYNVCSGIHHYISTKYTIT